MLTKNESNSLVLSQQVDEDPRRVVQTFGVVGQYHEIEVALHFSLRIEVQADRTGQSVDEERIELYIVEALGQRHLDLADLVIAHSCVVAGVYVYSLGKYNFHVVATLMLYTKLEKKFRVWNITARNR